MQKKIINMITREISKLTREVSQQSMWNLMTDVNNWNKWDEGIEDSMLSGNFVTGNSFTLKPKGGPKLSILLEEVEPSYYYRDLTRFPLAKMRDEHWFEQTVDGLKITVRLTISGLLSRLWYQLVMKGMVKGLEHEIENQIKVAKAYEIK